MAKPATLVLGTRWSRSLLGRTGGDCDHRQPVCGPLCPRHAALAVYPGAADLQNFGVLLVGLTLGSRRGFAALALYLIEGASGMPVLILPGRAAWRNYWGRRADSFAGRSRFRRIMERQSWTVGSWNVK